MMYTFDNLNDFVGYLSGTFTKNEVDDFYDVVSKMRLWYQFETFDLDNIVEVLKQRYLKSKWKVMIVPDFNDDPISNILRGQSLFAQIYEKYENIIPFLCPNKKEDAVLQTNHLYPPFEKLIYHLKRMPYLFIFNDENEQYFIEIDSRMALMNVLDKINQGEHPSKYQITHHDEMAYLIQLSDLHFGPKKHAKFKDHLLQLLDNQIARLPKRCIIKFLITGDLMDSPSQKNMYIATEFLNELKRRYHAEVQFVLGNHDMIVKGVNIFKKQKAKVVAYILGENVRVLEDLKIVLIKMNSSLSGNFARGKIGQRQLDEIDDELTTIENLDTYKPIVMLHHHLTPIHKADFLKKNWREKTFVGKISNMTKALIDNELVIDWMKQRHVHFAFHGHQHIPALNVVDNIYMIGAGTSTGVMKDDIDAYLSYNLIQYNLNTQKMISCTLFYEDVNGLLPKHMYTMKFKEE